MRYTTVTAGANRTAHVVDRRTERALCGHGLLRPAPHPAGPDAPATCPTCRTHDPRKCHVCGQRGTIYGRPARLSSSAAPVYACTRHAATVRPSGPAFEVATAENTARVTVSDSITGQSETVDCAADPRAIMYVALGFSMRHGGHAVELSTRWPDGRVTYGDPNDAR